ncbi:GRIP and coiled-coil domain-containing protein 2-like isoform X2 [Bacillus rossius redtenbacheri]|uniref:GRIP and coiled-coil domain-containing protein 2-like isoform X2 n=1 Tax=Bacillus rossius redtenbacheri TaxID=93214 RepID=UPI002FDD3021
MESEGKDGDKSEQKSPFESMGHEELVKRCTKFLSIAQSAKHAKDTYQQLLNEAETKVKQLEGQIAKSQQGHGSAKVPCKACEAHRKEESKLQNQISAMEEMVATLTEQKLSTAMEIDSLKKQNKILEGQLSDSKEENKKLMAELDERTEVGKKEVEDTNHLQLLRSEIETLSRDVEVLSGDNKNKSEEIKRVSEKFYNEKCALEAELKSVSSKLQSLSHMNDYLKEQLRVVTEEKDVVLKGIESIKSNNFELNQLVESIGSERDECLHSVEKLNAEKSKLSKLVNALNSSKTTILEENVSLKSEKQHLNECLKKLTCERDSLRESVTSAEIHLSRMLKQSLELLQNGQLSIVSHPMQDIEIDGNEKLELMDLISNLDNVLSKFWSIILNAPKYTESSVHSKVPDVNTDIENNSCSRFVSFESAKEIDEVFRQEVAAFSLQLSKLFNAYAALKTHEHTPDVSIFLDKVSEFLKSKVSFLEKQCTNRDSINTDQLGNDYSGLAGVETVQYFEETPQLEDSNLNNFSGLMCRKLSSRLECIEMSGPFDNISIDSLEGSGFVESKCLQNSNSSKQCVCTQTESIVIDTVKEQCGKCVQTDVCSSESSLCTNLCVVAGDVKTVKEIQDTNALEYENQDERASAGDLKDQLQVLHVKYQETVEKLASAEKDVEMLQSIVSEKNTDMTKLLDILLCLDGKNSKNAMNQVFEKLQKDKALCGVESIAKFMSNLPSQNVVEQLSLAQESECAGRDTLHDGDAVLPSDDASESPAYKQNVAELQKIVSKKKAEVSRLYELKSMSESQGEIIKEQEKEICDLNNSIKELAKAAPKLEYKSLDNVNDWSHNSTRSSCVGEVEEELKSGFEKQDQSCCNFSEKYSQLFSTFSKQEDDLANIQRVLDERNCELANLKVKLQNVEADMEGHRSELLKIIEEKDSEISRYKAEIDALKLKNTEEDECLKMSQQEIVEKNDNVDDGEEKVEDKENLSTIEKNELLHKQRIIDEQVVEINNYKKEIQDVQNQLKHFSHQLDEKEEIIEKLGCDIENYKHQILELEQNYQELKNQMSDNQQVIASKDREQVVEINNYKKEIQDVQNQLKHFSHQLDEKEEIIEKLGCDIENYKHQILELEQNYQELKNQMSDNQQVIASKDKEIEIWQNKFKDVERHMKTIELELVEKQQMSVEKDNEIETLKEEIIEIHQKYSEMEQAFGKERQIVTEKLIEVEKLNNEIVERDGKMEVCTKEIEYIQNQFRDAVTQKEAELEKHKEENLKLIRELDEIKGKVSEETQLAEQKDKDSENHRKQIENIMQQCMEAEIKLGEKQQIINEMAQSIDDYKQTIMSMEEHLKGTEDFQQKLMDNMHFETVQLRNDLAIANASCANKTTELNMLKEELSSLKNVNSFSSKSVVELTTELNNVRLEAAEKEEILKEKLREIEDLQRRRAAVSGELRTAAESLRALRASHGELRREGRQLREGLARAVDLARQEVCRQVESAAASGKTEVKELLGEMNEMNQVLKQRGETISKLKELKTELEQRWESASSELLGIREALSERTSELVQKDNEMRALEQQLQAQMEEQRAASLEQQEAMDSKVQKAAERIAELESRIAQFEQEREESQKEGGEVHSEVMSNSTISKVEETARLRDLEGSFEERFTKLRIFTVKLKKKASDLKEQLAQSEAEKAKLVSEKAELLSKISVMSGHTKNLQTLQQEYDCLQDQIEAEKSEVKSLKKMLEAAVTESTAVKLELQNCREEKESLSRELESCVRSKQKLDSSVKELVSQVQNLKKEKEAENIARKEKEMLVKRLEEDLRLKESRITEETEKAKALLDKIEESKQECVKNNVLNLEMAACEEQLRVAKAQQKELAALAADREAAIAGLEARLERKTEECESATLQLAALASEKQGLVDSLRAQQDLFTRQVRALEEQSARLKEGLAERDDELANLRDEYESYKVRAQSVLRQKSRGDDDARSRLGREDLAEEARQLRGRADALQARLEETSSHLQSSLSEQEALREEKTALLERCQELASSLAQARSQATQLQEAEKKTALDHQEAMRNQKLQYDMLTQCYKKQIEDLEARLQDETATLRQRLETAEEKLQGQQAPEGFDGQVPKVQSSADGKAFDPSRPEVEMALLKREDAEGSESTNSVSPNHLVSRDHLHHPVPLDKLLAATEEDNSVPGPERAAVAERQVRHLSALLSDAEQDLAKLTQQNALLKEEIRRQQRSVEREQHAQNFEYLKNVVVKFVTLQNGDERSRLVPVLNTILKLSPEETSQLAQVARGGSESSGSARGWGTYLHLWPSAQ